MRCAISDQEVLLTSPCRGWETGREQGMACALANSFAFQESAQQLGALQAVTSVLEEWRRAGE